MSKFNDYQEELIGYNLLRKTDIEALHEATLNLMENYGVKIYGENAREILHGAGCKIDKASKLVKFPRSLVNDAIESCPAEFTAYGRIPERDLQVGGKNVLFTNFGTGVDILDPYTNELRSTTKEDLASVTRVCDAIDEVDAFTVAVVAQDVNPELKCLHEAEAIFHNTTKHVFHDPDGGAKNVHDVIEIAAAVVGGKDKLLERPFVTLGCTTNSPLEVHEGASDIIIESARTGLPINILSMGLSGGTTPVTLAGTLVVCNAEILAGIILAQVVRKGIPVYYASSTTIMDLTLTTSPVGAPEHAMVGAAIGHLGHYYGIPTYVGGT